MVEDVVNELTHGIAFTVDTVAVWTHHEVLLAALAVRAVTVALAVNAVSTVLGQIVQMPVEEALVRMPVAVAGCMCVCVYVEQHVKYNLLCVLHAHRNRAISR